MTTKHNNLTCPYLKILWKTSLVPRGLHTALVELAVLAVLVCVRVCVTQRACQMIFIYADFVTRHNIQLRRLLFTQVL